MAESASPEPAEPAGEPRLNDETQDLERVDFDPLQHLDEPADDEEVDDLLAAVRLPEEKKFDPFASAEMLVPDVDAPSADADAALAEDDHPTVKIDASVLDDVEPEPLPEPEPELEVEADPLSSPLPLLASEGEEEDEVDDEDELPTIVRDAPAMSDESEVTSPSPPLPLPLPLPLPSSSSAQAAAEAETEGKAKPEGKASISVSVTVTEPTVPVAAFGADPAPPGVTRKTSGPARLRTSGRFDMDRLKDPTSKFDAESTITITRALQFREEAELREQIERTWKLLEHLEREEGMYTDPLETRLAAAKSLLERGELASAEVVVEEIGVLAQAMKAAGALTPGRDPMEARIARVVSSTFQKLIEGDLFSSAVNDKAGRVVAQVLEDTISGPMFQAAVLRLVQRRLDAHVEEEAFESAVRGLLERRLEAHLASETFAEKALSAVVSRPQALVDRPELRARMEAVARALDHALVDSSRLRERMDDAAKARARDLVRDLGDGLARDLPGKVAGRVLDDPRLPQLVRARIEEALPRVFESPAATAALDARAQGWATTLIGSPQFQDGIDGRVRRLVDEIVHGELFLTELDMRTRELLKTAEFRMRLETLLRGSQALGDVLEERLDGSEQLARKLDERLAAALPAALERALGERAADRTGLVHDLIDDGEFLAKVDEVARKRTEALVEAAGFRAAVDARVRALTGDLAERVGRDLDQRLQAATGDLSQAAADKALEAPALRARAEAAAARALEPLVKDLQLKLDRASDAQAAMERKVEVLVKTALAEGGAVEARLKAMADESAKKAVEIDEEWVRRIVQRELTNREALQTARLSGDGLSTDPMTALLRSEGARKIIAEHISVLKRERDERKARKEQADDDERLGAPPGSTVPPGAALRSKRTTERITLPDARARSELDTSVEPPEPRRPKRPSGAASDEDAGPPPPKRPPRR